MTDILEIYGDYSVDTLNDVLKTFFFENIKWVRTIASMDYFGYRTLFINDTPWYAMFKGKRVADLIQLGDKLVSNGVGVRLVSLRGNQVIICEWNGKRPKPA